MLQLGSGNFEIILGDDQKRENLEILATGRVNPLSESVRVPSNGANVETKSIVTKERFYDSFENAGYSLGQEFALVNDLYHYNSGI